MSAKTPWKILPRARGHVSYAVAARETGEIIGRVGRVGRQWRAFTPDGRSVRYHIRDLESRRARVFFSRRSAACSLWGAHRRAARATA